MDLGTYTTLMLGFVTLLDVADAALDAMLGTGDDDDDDGSGDGGDLIPVEA